MAREPSVYDTSPCAEYKEALQLISRNEERLQATMTDAQKELFSHVAVFMVFEMGYIETALYLILVPNTGLFFAYYSICCGFSGCPETVYCVLSLICRLNLQ